MRKLITLLCCCIGLSAAAQQKYRTSVFQQNIKTLQIGVEGQRFALPIIELNGSDKILVSFDEMSHVAHSYSYRVLHCNSDWTLSSLNSNEYLSGYTNSPITDAQLSLNTTFLYTHYAFRLPNDDINFRISGNYVVQVYEDNNVDNPVAQACFNVVEPKVSVSAKVRGNTDTELAGSLQQLDFEVATGGYVVREPSSEIKVVVRQNNRTDNEVSDLEPTFMSSGKLSYINNKSLIFEGGNEYHRFDISNVYAAAEGVDAIRFDRTHYNAYLFADKVVTDRSYAQNLDVNGKFVINLQSSDADSVEADYMYVYFNLPMEAPFFDGQLYLGGEYNFNQLNGENRLMYDVENKCYYKKLLLKQGGYNYQYWFVPKGTTKATTRRVDGCYWQTRNEYAIYVYHRPFGERYDRLIAVKQIEN